MSSLKRFFNLKKKIFKNDTFITSEAMKERATENEIKEYERLSIQYQRLIASCR